MKKGLQVLINYDADTTEMSVASKDVETEEPATEEQTMNLLLNAYMQSGMRFTVQHDQVCNRPDCKNGDMVKDIVDEIQKVMKKYAGQ